MAGAAAAAAAADGGEGEELLLLSAVEAGNGGGAQAAAEESWRLNFDGFRPPEAHQQERPPAGALHHCLGVLGPLLSAVLPASIFFPCLFRV
jgi:hypothetical protein